MLELIKKALGDKEFSIETKNHGWVQITPMAMHGLSDTRKVEKLAAALGKLREVGLDPMVSLTYLDETTMRYQSWPCIWVAPK